MKANIVIGAGYGDEAKGKLTSFLCDGNIKNPMVVRFNGGHQAGHTVSYNGIKHVFSSFGAGTLQNVPTYWSKYCTFFPTAAINEFNVLKNKSNKLTPTLYLHPLCPVTTPYDVEYNKRLEKVIRHGSVGVGFGATISRHEKFYKLYVQDLFYPAILKEKLNNIADNYYCTERIDCSEFIEDVEEIIKHIKLSDESILLNHNLIFEGAQGILLDQDFGFFPNVTRSNTTSKNALEIINLLKTTYNVDIDIEIYYATRAYQTRHGNGFMSREGDIVLKNNENETNKTHEFQGNFRTGSFDIDMFNYAVSCDGNFSKGIKKNIYISCLDQVEFDFKFFFENLKYKEQFTVCFCSNGAGPRNMNLKIIKNKSVGGNMYSEGRCEMEYIKTVATGYNLPVITAVQGE